MRLNLPVTDQEYVLAEGRSIVSKTDLDGNIQYVNPYFCEVSGYTEDELMGQPQNIIRHPDMPPAAFADMWATIRIGLPWTGVVKNRRKNGGYYWVLANVTPIAEGGRTLGYMSVRTRPSHVQVRACEALYRDMREGRAAHLLLRQGALRRRGPAGWLAALRAMPLSRKLGCNFALSAGLMAASAGIGLQLEGDGAWIALLALGGITLQGWQWLALHRGVAAPVAQATRVARAIAAGDLSREFSQAGHDDMGQLMRALQQMNVNLVAIIQDVRTNVASMQAGTRAIAAGNADLAHRTTAQAASLEETAASMEQFASTVKQNSDAAAQGNALARQASETAARGGAAVSRVGATMNDISASARKIVDIIGLIDGIAFQTNILALNASVEAARAGEQGRGFAVVAGEVRSLAQRSATAAREIKHLIDDSAHRVEEGNRLVAEAMGTVDDIVQSVQQVAGIIEEISTASGEQNQGITQVNGAVAHLDQVTQQNAQLVEEAATAAAGLDKEAVHLSQAVSVFKLRKAT
ncbi:methyl-accepting chemotaxis sensory transducer with Pas/Pac sensor [Noviherbaspirillum humi]|uniref:Methyl-accepting chemotaxis sensory transducer with Pas/Pac sensor n=1 Tax=Noviherbaspirillum humi TaxID=1688639 RepID=A0A239IVS4_9BURK|nr:methyl-accepting chemotaxis protein [Noviherbaspirillum humi]SNS97103.1 methyl-accepting chemotaxis sensory transducer with Pas/Pac sensor [Noviherbaspirillum humi]